jgi:cell division protein FtsL
VYAHGGQKLFDLLVLKLTSCAYAILLTRYNQRRAMRSDKLLADRKKKLNQIGFEWDVRVRRTFVVVAFVTCSYYC